MADFFYNRAPIWAPLLFLYIQVFASFFARFLARSLLTKLEGRPAPLFLTPSIPSGPEMVMAAVALDLAGLFIPVGRGLPTTPPPDRFLTAFMILLVVIHLALYVLAQLLELRAKDVRQGYSPTLYRSRLLGVMVGFLAMITNGWTLRFLLTVSGGL